MIPIRDLRTQFEVSCDLLKFLKGGDVDAGAGPAGFFVDAVAVNRVALQPNFRRNDFVLLHKLLGSFVGNL